MHYKIVIIIFLFSFSSCVNRESDSLSQEIKQTVISIPKETMLCLSPKNQMTQSNYNRNPDYRYVYYCDSTMCSLCELQRMSIWNVIIDKTHKTGVKMEFLFIFNPGKKHTKSFIDGYTFRKFKLKVWVDSTGTVLKNNPILKNSILHAFILDKNNHIVKIGDPSRSEEIEKEFFCFLKSVNK